MRSRLAPTVLGAALVAIVVCAACGTTSPGTPTGPSIDSAASPGLPRALTIGKPLTWECFTANANVLVSASCGDPSRLGLYASTSALNAPGDLTSSVSGTTVTLSWRAPAGSDPVVSYIIEAGSGPGLTDVTVFETGNTQTTLTVINVPAATYFVRVRGRDANGQGPVSNESIVRVIGPDAGCTPAPPTGLNASVSGVAGTTLLLQWTPPPGNCSAATYKIEVGSASGAQNLATFFTGQTSFTGTNTAPGTYYVRVRSGGPGCNACANLSDPSNEIVITVMPGTFTASFSGHVNITVTSIGGPDRTPTVCIYTYWLTGTIRLETFQGWHLNPAGMARGQGTRTQVGMSGSNKCSPTGPGSDALNFQDVPVHGSISTLRFSNPVRYNSPPSRDATTTLEFSGSIAGGSLSGNVTYAHQGRALNESTTTTEIGSARFPLTPQ